MYNYLMQEALSPPLSLPEFTVTRRTKLDDFLKYLSQRPAEEAQTWRNIVDLNILKLSELLKIGGILTAKGDIHLDLAKYPLTERAYEQIEEYGICSIHCGQRSMPVGDNGPFKVGQLITIIPAGADSRLAYYPPRREVFYVHPDKRITPCMNQFNGLNAMYDHQIRALPHHLVAAKGLTYMSLLAIADSGRSALGQTGELRVDEFMDHRAKS